MSVKDPASGKNPDDRLKFDRSLFQPGERVCCAVSGGADSVALLLALHRANAERESLGTVLSAVHVHHGLRGEEADADEAFVRNLCDGLGVSLAVMRVDTAARQSALREGLEEAARELRYQVFHGLLREQRADVVATAHTLDDQAETVVLKWLRGAWTEGLAGIAPSLPLAAAVPPAQTAVRPPAAPRETQHNPGSPPRGPRVVRPLLGVRRSEVERFLRSAGQSWREDSSNAALRFTRNRVRHQLLPELRTYNPAIAEALARTAEIARDEESFWTAEVARLLPQMLLPGRPVRGGGRAVGSQSEERAFALDIARLRTHPAAVQRRLLRAAAREAGARLNAEETARLMLLADLVPCTAAKSRIGAVVELHGGLRVERSARELRFMGRFGAHNKADPENSPPPRGSAG